MVPVEYPKHTKTAAILVKRAAAVFVFSAKTGEINSFLPVYHNTCLNSKKWKSFAVVLSKQFSFKKDAALDGAASFSCSTKTKCFRRKKTPLAFLFGKQTILQGTFCLQR